MFYPHKHNTANSDSIYIDLGNTHTFWRDHKSSIWVFS